MCNVTSVTSYIYGWAICSLIILFSFFFGISSAYIIKTIHYYRLTERGHQNRNKVSVLQWNRVSISPLTSFLLGWVYHVYPSLQTQLMSTRCTLWLFLVWFSFFLSIHLTQFTFNLRTLVSLRTCIAPHSFC